MLGLVLGPIIVATGATIGGTGPLTSASTAAEGLKPVAGAFATTLFGIGLLGAFGASAQEVSSFAETPPAHQRYSAVGLASWYGDEVRGATADGDCMVRDNRRAG